MTRVPRIAATVLGLAVAAGGLAAVDSVTADAHVATEASGAVARRAAFHDAMRRLWEDHITWTRQLIVSAATGPDPLPDLAPTAERLLENQVDIGDAIRPFYGDAAGDRLSGLLRDHILTAVDLVTAAKAGNPDAVADASSRWYANADEIATFLSEANPRYWPLAEMKAMMTSHLDLTLKEAVARLQGRYADDIAAYDEVHADILAMADMLSDGIIRQFPNAFAR